MQRALGIHKRVDLSGGRFRIPDNLARFVHVGNFREAPAECADIKHLEVWSLGQCRLRK
jgi:hypothetical protein